MESELFGYEKGAFTGAVARHMGLFEQANGSTLFLDEIGDLTQSTQAKLLRVLQEKEVRRIGGNETIKLDVRIIAATNKKLEKEIEDGKFREDLYYRLNVIAFALPPLRDRLTDIPLLIEHFLRKLDNAHQSKKTIEDDVLQCLMHYSWPGNVRQLESVLERSYILCDTDTITMEHVPAEVRQSSRPQSGPSPITLKLDELINARLTAAEYRLYLYLTKLDPDGELSDHLFEPKEIAEHLGINRDTFFVGVSKLKELRLYDYKARMSELKSKTSKKTQ